MKSVIGFSHFIYEQYLRNAQFVSFQSDRNSTLDNPQFLFNNFASGACSENLRLLMTLPVILCEQNAWLKNRGRLWAKQEHSVKFQLGAT